MIADIRQKAAETQKALQLKAEEIGLGGVDTAELVKLRGQAESLQNGLDEMVAAAQKIQSLEDAAHSIGKSEETEDFRLANAPEIQQLTQQIRATYDRLMVRAEVRNTALAQDSELFAVFNSRDKQGRSVVVSSLWGTPFVAHDGDELSAKLKDRNVPTVQSVDAQSIKIGGSVIAWNNGTDLEEILRDLWVKQSSKKTGHNGRADIQDAKKPAGVKAGRQELRATDFAERMVPQTVAIPLVATPALVIPAIETGTTSSLAATYYFDDDVTYDEILVARVASLFKAGILSLRVALSEKVQKTRALLAKIGIRIRTIAESAAVQNTVTLASKPETLNPAKINAARAVFGETTFGKTSDVFIVGATFAFDRWAIAAVRAVFGDAAMAVLVRNDEDRAKLAKVNAELAKAGRPEILKADDFNEVKAFMAAEKVRQSGIGRELRFKAIVDANDPMAIALKEMIPDVAWVNDGNFGSFLFQAGDAITKIMADFQRNFAVRKSA